LRVVAIASFYSSGAARDVERHAVRSSWYFDHIPRAPWWEGPVSEHEGAEQPIRVVIADDEPAVADYLRLALSLEDGGFEVVGVAGDAGSTVDLVTELEPDVILLDLQMPGGGANAAQLLASLSPSTKVLVFTADAEGSELLPLLRSGIAGYLTKSASSEEVVAAVRAVAVGRPSFEPEIAGKALDELTTRLHAERGDELRAEQAQQRIDRAIRTRSFTIVCQPVVDLATGTACGVEALARFPGTGGRSNEAWWAEARSVDRLLDLEVAVARAALAVRDTLAEHLWLSISLSPMTVLSGEIDRLLAGTDLTRLVIELTERADDEDDRFLSITLDRWRGEGLRVAVDDTGGGYASLAHLVNARPDYIKLDRGLTADIDTDTRKQSLLEAASGFALHVGVDVIAGAIETEAQRTVLRGSGVRYGQGPLFGATVPLEEQPASFSASRG
jgi:EAL domain-containing protein (putative c-di-GMP-specific phosphodiesterase class I)/DNA-binding NarL/FixJ family response regulator